ncbi:hypothetical protein MWMV8_MWMV8_02904 [Acinetobacter calcoaceticus]|jgi:TonB family protein|nr:hypothetical protein MWMV8_MWMV8_02904 [Acinetobacter calcoaceticus]
MNREVVVAFEVNESGKIESLIIIKSSSLEFLYKKCLKAMKNAGFPLIYPIRGKQPFILEASREPKESISKN